MWIKRLSPFSVESYNRLFRKEGDIVVGKSHTVSTGGRICGSAYCPTCSNINLDGFKTISRGDCRPTEGNPLARFQISNEFLSRFGSHGSDTIKAAIHDLLIVPIKRSIGAN